MRLRSVEGRACLPHHRVIPTRTPTPREIRRAFGSRAVEVIDSHGACLMELQRRVSVADDLAEAVKHHTEQIAALRADLDGLKRMLLAEMAQ